MVTYSSGMLTIFRLLLFFKKRLLFLFSRIPLCALINKHCTALAAKFPATKFIRSISTTCIPNYPDHNLPTIFIYHEGDMKGQLVGPIPFGGMNLSQDGMEGFSLFSHSLNIPFACCTAYPRGMLAVFVTPWMFTYEVDADRVETGVLICNLTSFHIWFLVMLFRCLFSSVAAQKGLAAPCTG